MNFSIFFPAETQRRFCSAASSKGTEAVAWFVKRVSCCVFLALVASFLFLGCSDGNNHDDTGFIPVGVWESYDRYTITKGTVDYFMEGSEWKGTEYPDTVLKGSIESASDFSHNSGVLIIKITDATYNTVNKFTGIYYSEYLGSSIKMATAYENGSVETDTLTEALSLFTVDKVGDHVAVWGSYTK